MERYLQPTTAFDLGMCRENGFIPVEFDGKHHGMLHSHTQKGKLHIDYLEQHGSYDFVPIYDIIKSVKKLYGTQFLECWTTGTWDYYLQNNLEENL